MQRTTQVITVQAGEDTSNAVDISTRFLAAIITGENYPEAKPLIVEVSPDGVNFFRPVLSNDPPGQLNDDPGGGNYLGLGFSMSPLIVGTHARLVIDGGDEAENVDFTLVLSDAVL